MPIHQAFQLGLATAQLGQRQFNGAMGSDQIIGRHLLPILSRERETLIAQQAAQFEIGGSAHTSPFAFATLQGQIARFVARLLG